LQFVRPEEEEADDSCCHQGCLGETINDRAPGPMELLLAPSPPPLPLQLVQKVLDEGWGWDRGEVRVALLQPGTLLLRPPVWRPSKHPSQSVDHKKRNATKTIMFLDAKQWRKRTESTKEKHTTERIRQRLHRASSMGDLRGTYQRGSL